MKLSDYVAEFCAKYVKHIFMVTGGGAMHLNDSIGKRQMEVAMQHEQAAAIAAEAYARINGLGVCCVTTGPGGTNALTGVAGAWLDSTPLLVLSGQVKRADMLNGRKVRQYGLQELPIIDLAKHVTKYAASVTEPATIRYHLERAYHEATTGRRGPVWLDIPLDVQSAEINPAKLIGFTTEETETPSFKDEVQAFIKLLNNSTRPVLLLGNGARADSLQEFINLLNVPVLSTWNAKDLCGASQYFGSPGAVAARAPNFILQNADLVISIGARLDHTMVGYKKELFCPNAKKVVIDIDPAELGKLDTDLSLCVDAGEFMQKIIYNYQFVEKVERYDWDLYCIKVNLDYPLFYDWVWELPLEDYDVIVPGSSGVTLDELWLSVELAEGQRMFSTMGLGAMGFAIPAAIGACLASGKPVLCVDGDGSFQLNIQELYTAGRLNLPIKFYYLNNGGYRSIQLTQDKFFDGRHVGSEFIFPDIQEIARVYGVDITEIKVPQTARPPRYDSMLTEDGKQTAMPLYDMFPPLPREELKRVML